MRTCNIVPFSQLGFVYIIFIYFSDGIGKDLIRQQSIQMEACTGNSDAIQEMRGLSPFIKMMRPGPFYTLNLQLSGFRIRFVTNEKNLK